MAHGCSQARSLIRAIAASLHHNQIQAACETYTTAHGNARTLTHWVRSGIEPATSWFLVGFINNWATMEILVFFFFFSNLLNSFLECFHKHSPTFLLSWKVLLLNFGRTWFIEMVIYQMFSYSIYLSIFFLGCL